MSLAFLRSYRIPRLAKNSPDLDSLDIVDNFRDGNKSTMPKGRKRKDEEEGEIEDSGSSSSESEESEDSSHF